MFVLLLDLYVCVMLYIIDFHQWNGQKHEFRQNPETDRVLPPIERSIHESNSAGEPKTLLKDQRYKEGNIPQTNNEDNNRNGPGHLHKHRSREPLGGQQAETIGRSGSAGEPADHPHGRAQHRNGPPGQEVHVGGHRQGLHAEEEEPRYSQHAFYGRGRGPLH